MARIAPRIHISADGIARLEALACQLPQDQRVQIELQDGSTCAGIVETQPSVQMFFDPQGREGSNAVVRIELMADAATAASGLRDLWLDEIAGVMRLPNPSPPEPSTRTPADPNAPAR